MRRLRRREERVLRMRISMNTDRTLEESRPAVLGDQRAYPADRGQGAAEAEASVEVKEAAELFG
jgi:hypothetical protein